MLANILAVGLMGTAMALSPMQPRYVVDNQNDTLTFSAEELNTDTYQYLANQVASQLEQDDAPIQNTTITYQSKTFNYVDIDTESKIVIWADSEEMQVSFSYNEEQDYAFFVCDYNYSERQWTASMTINNAEWFIANIKEPPSLTLSKYDLNNNKYTYLAEQINDEQDDTNFQNTSITYNGNTYDFEELISEENITFKYQNDQIYLILDNENDFYGHWFLNTEEAEGETPFTASMTINNAEWYLENMYAPLDSGDMMTAITSGLPLMASLAQAFLNGFTSIFWNSTNNTLTTFSNFALIMLSVAIVFACIKLVLNVVRSNTGV